MRKALFIWKTLCQGRYIYQMLDVEPLSSWYPLPLYTLVVKICVLVFSFYEKKLVCCASFLTALHRGVKSFISANQFQYPRTWYVISEKLYFTFMVWINYSHWIEFGKFLHSFMENISDLTECNVLFKYEHLILIWCFLLIDTEFDLKIF